ncbi:helix-turn-helix domain-containing protein [Saccharomonospora sp. NPDC046836]|uniref:sigma-54-dependent Fis family transcriptional regulator n=1 Tax=Saccharomonospora sp. NPDC046836 TaxID=3156921 RepID=UPI0033CC4FD8
MTSLSAPTGPPLPRSTPEWDKVREAKLDALSRDPFSVHPTDYPEVRPEVVTSWRRSMLSGVDPAGRAYTGHETFQSRTRLAAVARPIMNRLKDEISDLNCWGFLADRGCRLLTAVVGDFPEAERVHRQQLRPGMCFAEDVMGTNGLGCAHETQRAFIISGTEHFRSDTEILTTTGVILRDPFTKRYVGTLGAHCLREYSTAALLPLVIEIGRSIEAQLLASRTDGDREFFDAYSAAQRRYRCPVVGVSRRLFIVSTEARTLVREADEELLRRLAEESGSRTRTVCRHLSSGIVVTIEVLPVPQPAGEFAAVLALRTVEGDTRVPERNSPERPVDFRDGLERAVRDRLPVLLAGERGCGKRYEARAALTERPRMVVEFDGALAHLSPDSWLCDLADALSDERAAVLLGHVTSVPADLMTTVADLVAGARAAVVGTTTDDSAEDSRAVLVRESFVVMLTAPPLRERRHEFPALCESLLRRLVEPGADKASLTPRAVAALMASDWPGNIRQLQQVLASALIRVAGTVIDLQDLPSQHGKNRTNGPLDEVQTAERRVLMAALRETGGDRNAVAEKLGISRATVYRKLKRYELK